MFKKILFAADGSEHSIRAGEKAFDLATFNPDSQVHIVYVIDDKHAKGDVLHNWGDDTFTDRKAKMEIVEQKAKKAGINYELIFLHGDPGPTIVKYANKNECDAVVIGSRGLNVFQEMVLGSVSHKVAKRVNCPVLIVK